jgi:SRSO17 transposase
MTEPRAARPTVRFIDEYCDSYKSIFPEVRSFEAFKQLHVGLVSEIKRKTLPHIAQVVGRKSSQSLHHFITASPWSANQLKEQRLERILKALKGQEIVVIIDETGDRKKGKKTDYVSRQYIGNLGKIENGIVAVTAYGVIEGMTVMLDFEREVIYGKRRERRYWEITTNPETLPKNETWSVMTKMTGVKYHQVGNLYGLRNWVEYGLKQTKNELGWADFRLTNYTDIEKWWEIVASAYLLVSLHSSALPTAQKPLHNLSTTGLGLLLAEHHRWDGNTGWKNLLNNLRLIIQPFVTFNLINFWLKIFPIPELDVGFHRLISFMNRFRGAIPTALEQTDFRFSSA